MPGALSFKLLMALIGAIVVSGVSIKVTYDYCDGQQAREQLEAYERAMSLAKQLRVTATDLATARTQRETVQHAKDKIITKEVIRYVQVVPSAQRVFLPGAWRVLHDAAATGHPPGDGSQPDGATDPVEDAAALETIADNYEACRADQRRLTDLQNRVRLIEQTLEQ